MGTVKDCKVWKGSTYNTFVHVESHRSLHCDEGVFTDGSPDWGSLDQPPRVLLPLIREDLNSWIPGWVSVGASSHSWFPFAPHHRAPSGNRVLSVCDLDTYWPCRPGGRASASHSSADLALTP